MFRTALILLLTVVFVSGVQAKQLKIATEYPDGNSVLNELRASGKRIEERTEGRIKLKFYPGGVMGDAVAVKRKVRIGQLHGAFIHSGGLADVYKDSQVLNAPLLFRDFSEVDAVRALVDEEINQGFTENGWKTFGVVEGGFAFGMTTEPATSIDALKQQKIWLPANDPFTEKIAKSFGINPIALNIGDVLTALQTGAINAFVAPPVGAITLQWYSKTKYLTNAPFMYTYGVVGISTKALRGISDADMAILEEELTQSSKVLDNIAREDNKKAFKALESLGITILEPGAEDRAALEQESAKATAKLIESGEISQDFYDRIMVILNEIRSKG
ncbi:TRAP transporter substrate-binding protein DctP [Reinekea forsetii]|nr:TRAP transporter substrate-binding protein DctP [Reinekea forsetii]